MNYRIYGIPCTVFKGCVSAASDASYVPIFGTNTNTCVGVGTTIHPRCRVAALIEPRP
jgi:hypothetical protein